MIPEDLYQISRDGYAVRNGIENKNYRKIPIAKNGEFQYRGYEVPVKIYGWMWNTYFKCWSAFVEFEDGYKTFSYPRE